jgi:hypothetical protein
MELLSEYLTSQANMPIGQALRQAKQQYLSEAASGGFGTYHEKVMIESTLYGLPMYQVSVPNPAPWASTPSSVDVTAPKSTLEIEPAAGVHLEHRTLSFAYDPVHKTAQGQFYTLGGLAQASPGRPIQPKTSIPLAALPGQEPHGVLVLTGRSVTDAAFNPVIARPVPSTTLGIHEPEFTAQTWFPDRTFALNRLGTQAKGTAGRLVIVPAQYRGTQNLGQERRFTRLEIAVSYSDSPDTTPPVIWRVESDPTDRRQLSVTTGDASSVEQVWATYSTDGDVWQSIELVYSAYTERWEGTLPEGAEKAVYVIQAMDAAGNVAQSGNKGQFFGASGETKIYMPVILNDAQP